MAALLGIGVKSLKNRARSQLPEFVKNGRRRLFKGSSVRELLGVEDGPLVPARRSPTKYEAVGYPPRGMSRQEAARYIGVHAAYFDTLIQQGRMPRAMQIGAHEVWDRIKIESAFSLL